MDASDDSDDAPFQPHAPQPTNPSLNSREKSVISIGSSLPESPRTPTPSPLPTLDPPSPTCDEDGNARNSEDYIDDLDLGDGVSDSGASGIVRVQALVRPPSGLDGYGEREMDEWGGYESGVGSPVSGVGSPVSGVGSPMRDIDAEEENLGDNRSHEWEMKEGYSDDDDDDGWSEVEVDEETEGEEEKVNDDGWGDVEVDEETDDEEDNEAPMGSRQDNASPSEGAVLEENGQEDRGVDVENEFNGGYSDDDDDRIPTRVETDYGSVQDKTKLEFVQDHLEQVPESEDENNQASVDPQIQEDSDQEDIEMKDIDTNIEPQSAHLEDMEEEDPTYGQSIANAHEEDDYKMEEATDGELEDILGNFHTAAKGLSTSSDLTTANKLSHSKGGSSSNARTAPKKTSSVKSRMTSRRTPAFKSTVDATNAVDDVPMEIPIRASVSPEPDEELIAPSPQEQIDASMAPDVPSDNSLIFSKGETAIRTFRKAPSAPKNLPSPFYVRTVLTEIERINNHTIYNNIPVSDSFPVLQASTLGAVRWKAKEKEKFLDALSVLGKDAIRDISKRVGTKSEIECNEYLRALEEATEQRFETDQHRPGQVVQPWHIPMAFEIPPDLEAALDWEAERLRKDIDRREEMKVVKEWGEHAIIDDEVAEFLDRCVEEEDYEMLETVAPEAALLNVTEMLTLSREFFMNGPGDDNFRTVDPTGNEPSIYYPALRDFHKIAVGITRRLVVASMLAAETRQQHSGYRLVEPYILDHDVRTAAESLGLPASSREYWVEMARRNKLRVVQNTHEYFYINDHALTYEQVEGFLTRLSVKNRRVIQPDTEEFDIAVEGEAPVYRRAWLSVQPPSPSPENSDVELDAEEFENQDAEQDGEDTSDGEFICPSSPEPEGHGPIETKPGRMLKRDCIRFTNALETALHRIDKHLNTRSTIWHWRRFFRQSPSLALKKRNTIPPPQPVYFRKKTKQFLAFPSNWRKNAISQSLRSYYIRRKPTPAELLEAREKRQQLRKPTPWCWKYKTFGYPSWLSIWGYHKDVPPPRKPEDEGKTWVYTLGKWVKKPETTGSRISRSLVALRRQRKMDIRRRQKLGKPGELLEPGFPPPYSAYPMKDWRKYLSGKFYTAQGKNMVLRAWKERPKPVLWGVKYSKKDWEELWEGKEEFEGYDEGEFKAVDPEKWNKEIRNKQDRVKRRKAREERLKARPRSKTNLSDDEEMTRLKEVDPEKYRKEKGRRRERERRKRLKEERLKAGSPKPKTAISDEEFKRLEEVDPEAYRKEKRNRRDRERKRKEREALTQIGFVNPPPEPISDDEELKRLKEVDPEAYRKEKRNRKDRERKRREREALLKWRNLQSRNKDKDSEVDDEAADTAHSTPAPASTEASILAKVLSSPPRASPNSKLNKSTKRKCSSVALSSSSVPTKRQRSIEPYRSPRTKRDRRQVSVPLGFVPISEADLEAEDDGLGGNDGQPQGDSMAVEEYPLSDTTVSEYEE